MHIIYYGFGLCIGLAIATQSAINNQLKIVLGGSTLLAALVSFVVGSVCLVGLCLFSGQRFVVLNQLQNADWWMMLGGVLGAFFVFGTTLLAPRLGVTTMISLIIFGQVAMSLILDKFGFLGLDTRDISVTRLAGVAFILVGTLCISLDNR